jgi:hypothetical protein
MGYVFRTEEQQGAVDGLRRYLAAKVDPLFNKEYRDTFVPRENGRNRSRAQSVWIDLGCSQ